MTTMNWPLGLIVPVQDPTPFSVFLPNEWPHSLAQVKAAGYSVVELAITDPTALNKEEIKALIHFYGLKVAAFTTGQAADKEGLSLSSPDEKVRERSVVRIMHHAKIAQDLDAVVIIGLLRGKVGDLHLLRDSLKECTRSYSNVRFALEPLNRYETTLINTVSQAIEVLEYVGSKNLGLLFDTFHANIEEPSIFEAIKLCGDRLFHVHLADTNRWIPGFGHFPFSDLWRALEKINYKGAMILECFPYPKLEQLITACEVKRRVGLC
ncbi:MAG: TIM barrel protein [Limisphaerales bacterium]